MKTSFTFLLPIFALSSALQELPSSLEVCPRNGTEFDTKCWDRTAAKFIKSLALGLPSLDIPPIEPLVLDAGFYDDHSSLILSQEYSNITLHGLTEGLIVDDFNIDFENMILYSEFTHPKLDFVADYSLQVQILGLPVNDTGRLNLTLINVDATNTLYCQKYDKDGETFMRVLRYETRLSPGEVIVRLGGIFGNDNILGSQLKLSSTENSELVFRDMIPAPFGRLPQPGLHKYCQQLCVRSLSDEHFVPGIISFSPFISNEYSRYIMLARMVKEKWK